MLPVVCDVFALPNSASAIIINLNNSKFFALPLIKCITVHHSLLLNSGVIIRFTPLQCPSPFILQHCLWSEKH